MKFGTTSEAAISENPVDFCIHLALAVFKRQKTVTYKPLSRRDQRLRTAGDVVVSPYGQVGDVLWVREPFGFLDGAVVYQASYAQDGYRGRMTLPYDLEVPPVSMVREQARMLLTIQTIDVVTLQSVDEAAAVAAGTIPTQDRTTYLDEFKAQWDEAYRREQWSTNPSVWRMTFTLND